MLESLGISCKYDFFVDISLSKKVLFVLLPCESDGGGRYVFLKGQWI